MSTLFTPRKVTKFIAIHCAATPPSADIGAKEIRQWHRAKGWIDIGYHFVIRRNGRVEKGRPEDVVGAHVEGHNSNSIGICLVGGVKEGAPGKAQNNFTPAQFAALAELLRDLKTRYPQAEVRGHRDFVGVRKSCPSFDVRQWLKETNVFGDHVVEDPHGAYVQVTNENPTIYRIAKHYGTTVEAILAANPGIKPEALKIGQSIRLPD